MLFIKIWNAANGAAVQPHGPEEAKLPAGHAGCIRVLARREAPDRKRMGIRSPDGAAPYLLTPSTLPAVSSPVPAHHLGALSLPGRTKLLILHSPSSYANFSPASPTPQKLCGILIEEMHQKSDLRVQQVSHIHRKPTRGLSVEVGLTHLISGSIDRV